MKGHPFVRYTIGLIAGILLYVQLPAWYELPLGAIVLGMALLIWGFVKNAGLSIKPIDTGQGLGGLLIILALGWAITYQRTESNRPDSIVHLADTRDSVLLRAYEGVVSTQPEERAKTYRVELSIRRGEWSNNGKINRWKPLSGRVIVYLDKVGTPLPRYGEVWLVSGAPRPIDPPLNPGEFDYKQYLQYRNIHHQQYVRPFQRRILAVVPPNRITHLATVVNRWADSVFTQRVGSRAEYGIVNAMILGVRDDLDTEQYRAYSAAGAVHILSVSGMHVGILFAVLTYLLSFLIKRPRGKILMAGLQLVILWFYALVTGFSPPVLRSAGMFTVLIVANAMGRQQQLANTLGASAFFILCYDPYALFSAGFQLSYLAVAGIGAWQSSFVQLITFRYKAVNKVWELTAVAIVAQLITFPLGVFYFHQFPTYFLVANPLVMASSIVLLPLAMATLAFSWVPYLNDILGWLLQKVALFLNYVVTQTSQFPGAAWNGLWLSSAAMLLIYDVIFCAVALLLNRHRAYIWATCVVSLLLAGLVIYEDYNQRHQHRLAVHFLPHRTAVSLTDGYTSTLLTDLDSADTRSYDFYLKNTFGQWGIRNLVLFNPKNEKKVKTGIASQTPVYFRHRDYILWVWRGKTLLLVNKLSGYKRWRLPAVVDYLIIRRNALQQWSQLDGRVVARHIVFDDSSKTPLTDRLLGEARQQGIACFSVRQMGAYVVDL